MWMTLGAKVHAWVNSIGRPSEASKTRRLREEVEQAFAAASLSHEGQRDRLINTIAKWALEPFGLDEKHSQYVVLQRFIKALLNFENLFVLPGSDADVGSPSAPRTTAEHWEVRNELIRQRELVKDLDVTAELIRLTVCHVIDALYEACPSLKDDMGAAGLEGVGEGADGGADRASSLSSNSSKAKHSSVFDPPTHGHRFDRSVTATSGALSGDGGSGGDGASASDGRSAPSQATYPHPGQAIPLGDGFALRSDLTHLIPDLGTCIDAMAKAFFAEELVEAKLFERMRLALETRLVEVSGGNPADLAGFKRQLKFATSPDAERLFASPRAMLEAYLGKTPLLNLFDQSVSFVVPTELRFKHHHLVAGSGHGKTQTLQHMLVHDLEEVAARRRSVVVIDSQSDLIRKISSLACFAPGGALEDRLVLIDPNDVEYPVSLNLFDVGQDRLASYDMLERERLTNSILELYDFVLGSLLEAEMTQKQSVIFRYLTRLMLHIPGATIHTFIDLLRPGGADAYGAAIAKLDRTAREFFTHEYDSREFTQTKAQVLRRLYGILETRTFERMFSHPKSKLDLYAEMNKGKVILINTAKDLLKESLTQVFGRFFIALIAQAAQERAVIPEDQRMPTFVYIDEAADYFDKNIGVILKQARKYRVGLILAHQYLAQLDTKLFDGIAGNTSLKFAGKLSAKDARTMAQEMHCQPSLFENLPPLIFGASAEGIVQGAVPLKFPYGTLESLPTSTKAEQAQIKGQMRMRYATHYSDVPGVDAGGQAAGESSGSGDGATDRGDNSAELDKSGQSSDHKSNPDKTSDHFQASNQRNPADNGNDKDGNSAPHTPSKQW